jgi:hypothetical protein
MFIFGWVVAVLVLILIAQLALVLPTMSRTFWREHRLAAQRPRWRAVLFLTVIELALVLAWGIVFVADR